MRFFFGLIFIVLALFAELNETIIKETNTTKFQTLLKELNQSAPDYRLQRTLLYKIISLQKQTISLLSPKELEVKNDKEFIDTFYKINAILAQSFTKQDEIEDLAEQLQDIKDNSDEANASLTSSLEYAYYLKQKRLDEKYIQLVNDNYKKWLDTLLAKMPKIQFSVKDVQKRIKKALKSLQYLEKRIKKLKIEYERYTILQSTTRAQRVAKDIAYLSKKKERYVKIIIKAKLRLFFKHLKFKLPDSLDIAKDIIDFTKAHSSTPYLDKSFSITLYYAINKIVGDLKATFINIKNSVIAFLNNNSVIGIPLYKFSQALGIFLLFLLLRKIFALLILKSLHRLARWTKTTLDEKILEILEGPLKFSFIIIGLYLAFDLTNIYNDTISKVVKSLVIFVIFWFFYNAVNVLDETIYRFARKFGRELYREIGAFFIKTLKIFIFSIGLVSILQEWDINVSAFLASLGLGGLAFALAAKDSAANLFGGLSILADRALKIDDWIKVGDVEGVVEEIGLRTTKIRTFEKSLVTVPNQIIANNPIENFSRRNIRRIKMRIGIVYATTRQQMEHILADIRNMLQSHPGIAKNATLIVNFDEFEDSSLSIFIYCFTNTANWQKYLAIKEDINLKIMHIVQEHGSDFAFPSESIYIEKLPYEKNSDTR